MSRILFVEDDALITRIYSQQLVNAGFEVISAADGLEAMKQLKAAQPDLVVLDLLMPKFSGLDVLRFIRQDPKLKSTKVIVFSNAFLNTMGDQLAALNVQEMLLKAAVTPKQVIETIKRFVKPEALPAAPSIEFSAKAASHTPMTPAEAAGKEGVAEFSRRIRRDFFEQIPAINKTLRQVAESFIHAPSGSERVMRLEMLSRKMGFLTHMTSMAGCYRIAQLSSAFEALLYELQEKPISINESSLNTVRRTVELLERCLTRADQVDEQCLSPTSVLVVDDDAVSNRALVLALARHKLTATSITDPFGAWEKLKANRFDLILLDINMPGMDGLELCRRIRELPEYINTPVIFFTSHLEFEPRARSILGRGDDLIIKPVLPIELTVKVISNFARRRIENTSASSIEV